MSPEEYVDNIKALIAEYGWFAQGVFPNEGDEDKSVFTYTVGFTELAHPEFIVFCLDHKVAHAILTHFYDQVTSGVSFHDGQELTDVIQGYPVRLREVVFPNDWTAMVYNVYGDFSPVLQIVLPDKEGRFPGEPGCKLDVPVQPMP